MLCFFAPVPVEGNRISVRENEWLSKWAKEQVCSPETLSRCEKEEKAVAADSFELFYVKKKTVSSSSSVCSDLTFTFKPCGLWKSSPSNIDPAVVCTETEDGGKQSGILIQRRALRKLFEYRRLRSSLFLVTLDMILNVTLWQRTPYLQRKDLVFTFIF